MQPCVCFFFMVLDINKKENYLETVSQPTVKVSPKVALENVQRRVYQQIQQVVSWVCPSQRHKKMTKRFIQACFATSVVASASGCLQVPDLPASAFTVLQEEGKIVKKRTCSSYVHFFQKDGKYYSLPGIVTKNDFLPEPGEPHDVRDLSLVGEKVFPVSMEETDTWKLLQQFREQSLQLGTVSPYAFRLQGQEAIRNVQYEILTKLYTQLQQRFPDTLYNCADEKLKGAYYEFFVGGFADHHGFYANIDERRDDGSGVSDDLHVELVIGKKRGDAVLQFTNTSVAIEKGHIEQELLTEIQRATKTLDATLARIPALQRMLKKPTTLRFLDVAHMQKTTGTGGIYNGGVVIYDDPETKNRWRYSTIFHELVHAYDDQKKDEVLPPEEVIVAGEDIQQIQKTTERNEFIARAVEVFHHKEHSSVEERRLWIWDQLALQKKEDRYRPFRLAVVKFTERYIAERRKDPLFAQATSENPMTYEWFSMYGEEEYWELLGAYMEKLIAQIPTEVDVRK